MKESIIFSDQNLTEIVHYVYRVVIDGKYYIGKHTGFLNDLITGRYKTSSKLVKEKLENGHHFSKIKILKVFSTKEEALEYEEKYLTRVDAKRNPKFLNQTNGNKNLYVEQHTEESKAKMSKKRKEYFNPETELGRRNKENMSKKQIERFNPETEEGIKSRENMSEKTKERFNPNTERGRKNRERNRNLSLKQFDPNTEEGRRNRENHRNLSLKQFDINTEEGRQQRENLSKIKKAQFDPNAEYGRKLREKISEIQIEYYKTEHGIKKKENHSKFMKENGKIIAQKTTETKLQKRKDDSILGELMFDEEFIKENFLIIDDKNRPRFLWSVYSELSGYSGSRIGVHKREGKLSFLRGITSISLTEEQELAKIEEIKAIIKSRNNT